MSFEFVKKLPAPNEIKRDFPVPERIARLKAQRDAAMLLRENLINFLQLSGHVPPTTKLLF